MKILGWIIATPFIILALYALLRFAFCRPSYFVVETATPMVEKMADHIVTHGIPESLDEIPGLPYELNNCKRKYKYEKRVVLKDIQVASQKEADWSIIDETCSFQHENTRYSLWFWFVVHYNTPKSTHGKLRIKSSKTSVGISFDTDKNNQLAHSIVGSGFDNRFGFCRQFKQ